MGYGVGKLYSFTVATGSGGSASIDLGRAYAKVYVCLVAPGAAVNVHASLDGTNYSALGYGQTVALSGLVSFLSTHSNVIKEIPGGMQYYKFINTTATGAGEAIRVWGSDS